jgi:hypothetical protein
MADIEVDWHHGDCRDVMKTLPDQSINAVFCDPPYPEISRDYGRMTEKDWHAMMRSVVTECRRVLKPRGRPRSCCNRTTARSARRDSGSTEFIVGGGILEYRGRCLLVEHADDPECGLRTEERTDAKVGQTDRMGRRPGLLSGSGFGLWGESDRNKNLRYSSNFLRCNGPSGNGGFHSKVAMSSVGTRWGNSIQPDADRTCERSRI